MRKIRQHIRMPYFVGMIAAVSGILTYWALTYNISSGENNYLIITLIYVDIALVLFLAILILRRLKGLWIERRVNRKGSKLHMQIVRLFSFVSVMPAIIVALFSAHFFNAGVDAWFAKPVRDALQQANVLAQSYLEEHKKVIQIDAFALADQIRPRISHYLVAPEELTERLNHEADGRKLAEVMVINDAKKLNVVARSFFTFLPLLEDLTKYFKKAKIGDVVMFESKDRVRALIKLDPITDTYLLIGKMIDPVVLQHVDRTNLALKDYHLSADRHGEIQVTFILFFTIVTFLLLMAAIWVGVLIADKLVQPITQLIEAAQAVSEGDYNVKLKVEATHNEIEDLCDSFNRMTHQLVQQKYDLIISEKKSAWADMARKIAHEIKNPLTPIQLSAERLRRKYSNEIQKDPQTFNTCIDTIVRQVGSIENLVTEFSNFARMPEPKMEPVDWVILTQEILVLYQQANLDIMFLFDTNAPSITKSIDAHQMNQVLNNLIQNSINSLRENISNNRRLCVKIKLHLNDTMFYIRIEDSGDGFPIAGREKLMEPYFTTRDKGTGLGLAIVSKIVSDHNGRLDLLDSEELGGACVQLSFQQKI